MLGEENAITHLRQGFERLFLAEGGKVPATVVREIPCPQAKIL